MNTTALSPLMLGAIAASSFAISLFFLKYWRSSRDRFYLLFSASFLIEAVNRAALGLIGASEHELVHYAIRCLAYSLIVIAIWDKNRRR
ncbi:MAG TPA: DUF5985 family protein [Rhizobacter sp.]